MARAVIAKSGDTIDKMLSNRGVERHERFTWHAKVRHLNPHIGDLNRIWPGDLVLLPDALHEPVGQAWIWQNVFNAIPDHLKRPWNGNIALEITIGEDTISSLSRRAFADTADRNLSPNIQRAVFLVNNSGALQPLLHAKHLPPSNTRIPSHTARHFRKQYFQAFQNQPSGRYMGTIGSQLKGRISTLKSVGRGATWYVPAVLSLHSVYTAPPELRMRTLFAEGFGVLGGGIGSYLGSLAGIGIVTMLGLGPFGLFVAILICATVGGIALYEGGKWVGGNLIYDTGIQLAGQSYSSLEQYLERYYDNN